MKAEARPLIDFENDMNIRLQREKQETAKSKLRDLRFLLNIPSFYLIPSNYALFSKYNEEMGYAVSYLVSSIGMSEEPKEKKKGAARKKSTKSAQKDDNELGKNQIESQSAEDKRRKSSEGEPKWQVGVPRPRLL